MSPGLKSAVTLTSLCVLLVVAVVWGFSAVTQPFPGRVETALCVDTTVEPGTRVYAEDVTVSVLNASGREGLAGRTMSLLTDEGFAQGRAANAPGRTEVRSAEIWTTDPDSVAVALVRSWLGRKAQVRRVDNPVVPGVVVVVGDGFRRLSEGRSSVVARKRSTFCTPPELVG